MSFVWFVLITSMLFYLLYFFFFFFKQKTAYEMRISDWSSDVCSSDLQSAVDLYTIDGKFFQPRQIGITRTEIVDSDTYALLPQSADLHQHFVIQFHGHRFGDLQLKLRSRNAVSLHGPTQTEKEIRLREFAHTDIDGEPL